MATHHAEKLRKISELTPNAPQGAGYGANHFVPVCKIVNRSLASQLKADCREHNIDVKSKTNRLDTQFYCKPEQLKDVLNLHRVLLESRPDTVLRKCSRDYDAFFLLGPLTLLSTAIAHEIPGSPPYRWIGVLVTGISLIAFAERTNRHYRLFDRGHWGIWDMLIATAIVGINLAVWRVVL